MASARTTVKSVKTSFGLVYHNQTHPNGSLHFNMVLFRLAVSKQSLMCQPCQAYNLLCGSLTLWLVHSVACSLCGSLTQARSLCGSLTLRLAHSVARSLCGLFTLWLAHSGSLTLWLAQSVARSLCDSFTLWLIHSLAHSLSSLRQKSWLRFFVFPLFNINTQDSRIESSLFM